MSAEQITALAVRVPCGFCWAPPGTPCTPEGLHLERYVRAYRRGLISREVMSSACLHLPVASAGQLVTQVTDLGAGHAAGDF